MQQTVGRLLNTGPPLAPQKRDQRKPEKERCQKQGRWRGGRSQGAKKDEKAKRKGGLHPGWGTADGKYNRPIRPEQQPLGGRHTRNTRPTAQHATQPSASLNHGARGGSIFQIWKNPPIIFSILTSQSLFSIQTPPRWVVWSEQGLLRPSSICSGRVWLYCSTDPPIIFSIGGF